MDDEMIERVAKAILETPNASDYKTLVARNAIKTMREPTKKMLLAGRNKYQHGSRIIWQTMIDSITND